MRISRLLFAAAAALGYAAKQISASPDKHFRRSFLLHLSSAAAPPPPPVPAVQSSQVASVVVNIEPDRVVPLLREPDVVLLDIRSPPEIEAAPYTGPLKVIYAPVSVENQDAMNEDFISQNNIDKGQTPIVLF